jgi:protein-L-isoaspartate(D-aspartate) O-methyltransferase
MTGMRLRLGILVSLLSLCLTAGAAEVLLDLAAARTELMRQIDGHMALTAKMTGIDRIDPRVRAAIEAVPRHEFVPKKFRSLAYIDLPLPIGHGQNISQPFLVALMTHLAQIKPEDAVFETGTGAGYQAAILSMLAKRIYSVEVVAPLAAAAGDRLRRLGFRNIEVRAADGYYGWRERGPFDAMIIKEAVSQIPAPLLNQLKPGGRLVAPIGPLDGMQWLTLIEKDADGKIHETKLLEVKFSPLQGGERI